MIKGRALPFGAGLLAVLLLASPVLTRSAPDAEAEVFFVAPDGKDAGSGRAADPAPSGTDGPFATLERARDAARAFAGRQPVRIVLRGGTYRKAQPLLLDARDSGTAEHPVSWVAYPGETPVLSGGRVLEATRVEDDGTWIAELPAAERTAAEFRHLYVRSPNAPHWTRRFRPTLGPFVVAGLTDAPSREGMRHRRSQDEFRYHPGDLERWPDLAGVEVVVLHDWSASRLRVRELDLEKGVVRFTGFPVYRVGHWWKDAKNPYYLENVASAWGRPGEWHLDRATGALRYRPAAGEDPHALTVVAPRTEQLVRLTRASPEAEGVAHVRFEGLTFQHTHWPLPAEGYSSGQGMIDLPAAFEVSGAEYCRIEGCTFSHLGGYAVELRDGASDNRVVGCRMWDLGGGGVKVGGGDGVPARNVVADNVISDGGLDHFSALGIWVGIADGTEVRHNLIRRFPYTGISVGWQWDPTPTPCRANVVADNHIHDVMRLLADGGGIYTLGLQVGTVLSGNHIHDVHRSRLTGRAPNNGIFFDQGSKDYRVEGNAIHRTSGKPIRFHQSQRDWHAWAGNHLGEPAPDDLAANAGPEGAHAQLARGLPPVSLPAVLTDALRGTPVVPRTVRVMTWNLHHGEGTDGVYDLTRIARVIQGRGADLVSCQEVDRRFGDRSRREDQPRILADLLGFHAYYGPTIDDRYGNLLLSRFPIVAAEHLSLPNPDGKEARGVIVAQVDVGGEILTVLDTHLCAWSETNRAAQVALLRTLLEKQEGPVLLGGDFNTTAAGQLATLIGDEVVLDTRTGLLGLKGGIDDILVTPSLRERVTQGRVVPGPYSDHPAYWIDLAPPD